MLLQWLGSVNGMVTQFIMVPITVKSRAPQIASRHVTATSVLVLLVLHLRPAYVR